jgi:LPS-assembly protein
MTSDTARQIRRLAGIPARLAALLAGAALPLLSAAQDNSAGGCAVNAEGQQGDCPIREIAVPPSHPFDWTPVQAVPPELRDRACVNCGGRYTDPLAGADRKVPPELANIEATAANSELEGTMIRLSGGVAVKQGYRRLSGDSAVIDRQQRAGQLTGNITFREPGLLLRGSHAEVFSRSGEARISDSQFVMHEQHLRGTAEALRRDSAGILHVEQGSMSYCAPGDRDWAIRASEMELDLEEGLGTAYGAKLDLAGVPVLYIPWMQFPLDDRRRTGLLWPDIGSDTRGGLDVAVPVYFNLAPNSDALYTPRYIQERGVNHEVKLRYLNPYIGSWSVGGAYMAQDDRYRDDFPDNRSYDRWLGVVKHQAIFNQRWRSLVDYSKASDTYYMKDLDASSLEAKRQTSLLQLASLDYLGDDWLVALDVQQFQSLADDINNDYKKLPQLTGQYRTKGTPFQFEPVLMAQFSNFDSDENRVTGERLYAEAGVTYPMLWSYGFLRPTAKYRHLAYDLDEDNIFTSNSPTAGAALASLDGGLYFERPARIAGEGLLQTLEPRLYYLYAGYEEQRDQPDFDSAELTFTYNQLFRETRFSGRDRLDDANQLSVGLTTRFINQADGRERASASLGQIFYFRDREVRLQPFDPPLKTSGSELAGELTFDPNRHLSLRSSLVWDPYSDKMNAGHILASYHWDDGKILNLGYSYRRPLTLVTEEQATDETHFSTYLPINNRWSLFAAWNYSIETHSSVEDMIGVEYDTCCWKVRLLHLRYFDSVPGQVTNFNDPEVEREHATEFQIVLKGMGGFGNRVKSIMEDMIRGFEESDEREF